MPNKSVTLYLEVETVRRLNQFALAANRSKSTAADLLILHGLANYDLKDAAPKKIDSPRKATKANTLVKKPALPPAGKRGRPAKAVSAKRKPGRPAKQKAA